MPAACGEPLGRVAVRGGRVLWYDAFAGFSCASRNLSRGLGVLRCRGYGILQQLSSYVWVLVRIRGFLTSH